MEFCNIIKFGLSCVSKMQKYFWPNVDINTSHNSNNNITSTRDTIILLENIITYISFISISTIIIKCNQIPGTSFCTSCCSPASSNNTVFN